MLSGRRTAREVALLVLFAGDLSRHESLELSLELFRDHLRDDSDVLTSLLMGSDELNINRTQLEKGQRLVGEDSNHWQFVERLVRGVEAHRSAIDDLIERFSLNWKVSRMGRVDRNVLRLAAFELAFESDVPTKATLNEAIEIAKRFGSEDSGKFVNGILDRLAQELGRV